MVSRKQPLNLARAIAYLRVSTDEQHLGVKSQGDAIRAWCRSQGVELVGSHVDKGIGGAVSLEDRPGLLAVLHEVRTKGIGIVILARRDRLARDSVLAGMLQRLVEREGAVLRSADNVGNGDSPEDAMMSGIVDVFSQFERAIIRARTRSALAAKKSRDERIGGIPWGFRLARNKVHLVRCESDWLTIERITRMRRRGQSLRRIAANLSRQGVRTKKGSTKWFCETVRAALRARST